LWFAYIEPVEVELLKYAYQIIQKANGPKAATKVKRAMHEMKEGKLKSGKSGKPVKSRKQAIAIGLSEARKGGGKVPARRSES
jgi:Family of unknown function (DUF6496)